jgi:hypothetical protein
MKYLKSFNEELKPETYIRAGHKLQALGKTTRGTKLSDYGTEKLHGHYNAHLSALTNTSLFTGEFTNIQCGFYYGIPHWNGPQTNVNSTLIKTHDEEDLVNNFIEGREKLSFTLEFEIFPTSSTEIRYKRSQSSSAASRKKLFCMIVELSYWEDGLREWNYLEDSNEYLTPDDEQYMNISEVYRNTKQIQIRLEPLTSKSECGIFADRKSALKFKKQLPELVGSKKSKIMDILSTVGGTTDDLEDILERIYSISVNYLYQDEVNPSSYSYKTWFNKYF